MFCRLVGDALAALQADDPGPAQQAVAEVVDLACDMKSYDYFHSDDPVEAAKFGVSDAVCDRPPAVPAVSRCRTRQHHGQAVTLTPVRRKP